MAHIAHKKNQPFPVLRFKAFDIGWEKKRLGEVFSIFNGYAFSSNDAREAGCRWVKIADVGINEINHDSTSYLPVEYREKYSKFLLSEGDYVVALTRPILGGKLKIAKIDKALDRSLLNQRVGKLVSGNDLTFVYTLLQKESLVARIENRIAGTDPPNLSPDAIDSLNQFIPSLPEQQKIASFLSAIDKKIQLLTRKKELLEQYKKGVMQQIFSGKIKFKDENRKAYPKWSEKKMDEFGDFKGGGTPNTTVEKYWKGNIPWISSSDIIEGDIHNVKINRYITEEAINESATKLIPKGSVMLVSRVGIGKLAISKVYLCTSQDFTNFIPKDCDSYYLGYFLTARKSALINLGQGTSIKGFTTDDIKQLRIPLPTLLEQQKIGNYLSAIDSKMDGLTTQIIKTQTFKKGLLQQMFV